MAHRRSPFIRRSGLGCERLEYRHFRITSTLMLDFSYPVVLVLFVFSILVERYIKKNKDNPAGLPLPPGPPRLPIVGNLFGSKDLGAQWLTYAEWGRKYVLMVKLMDWSFNVGFIPYGPSSMHQALNPQAMLSYQGLQLSKVHQMIRNILVIPHEMEAHLRTFTASTIMQVVYGYEMAPQDDLFASIADRASEMLTNSFFPGAALVNTFPMFQYLPEWCPGAGFKNLHANGTAPQSIVSQMIQKHEEEAVIKAVAGTTYAAAVETSSSALSAFMMAMIMFPEVQKTAQAEIDHVTGGTRMPDFGDRESMVYLEATYRKVLRWCQVTPLGVPHMTTESDVYNGYFIPKDTIVFANIWFMPERFIQEDGTLSDDLGQQQFGFGRRICVGKYLAEASVWIAMVSILAVFDVKKAMDEFGGEIDITPQYTPGVIMSQKAVAMVQPAPSSTGCGLLA
ncbi:cytochrome P450 [Suillus subaureus]|uniref:Cytochrome P450 n=1 Tax=Suillus subaureus TaxID=48587 RepID=A0A9P7EH46_9AGAM|nr:cytochrome P450 [Suillus subaureus]KAG1821682.1 cytochrome P450 [Suillus subaureus]